ncbi:UBX domain-containing protein [Entamoeba marina]
MSTIKWSTPAGVPAPTNYDNPLGQQKLPTPKLQPADELFQIVLPPKHINSIQNDLPDKFFELTRDDLNIMNTKQPEVLQSRSLKEDQRINRSSKFKKTTIKIKFPDGLVVVRNFHPLQPMSDVYKHIQEVIRNPDWGVVLKLSTGKRNALADDSQTLAKLGLVPEFIKLAIQSK